MQLSAAIDLCLEKDLIDNKKTIFVLYGKTDFVYRSHT